MNEWIVDPSVPFTALESLSFVPIIPFSINRTIEAREESLKSVDLYNEGVGNKQSGKYSGGMKRRLSVAISLIGDPKVDLVVYSMLHEDLGNVSYSAVGGLLDQIRELRESIELPLMNPELFLRVGIKSSKAILLYGPSGTGKTLLARAIASNIEANFLKPGIVFMDEIDAVGAVSARELVQIGRFRGL